MTLACACLLFAMRVRAQSIEATQPAARETRPWAAGVSEGEQAIALDLYVVGNQEFAESRFAQAIAKYKEAIRHWDHPAIRFNMAVSLIHLDQPVEARDNLVRSLVHGAAALNAELYAQALTYQKLLDAQLGHAAIACLEPGAEVTLDGKVLFTGPGTADLFLLPGEHQVVATKPGFLTASRTLVLVAGKLTTYDITPAIEAKPVTRMVRRWDTWKPWTVLGTGAGIAALGTVVYVVAREQFAVHDRTVDDKCPHGCTAEELLMYPEIPRQKRRAENEQVVAFSLLSAGGAVIVAGLVGLVLNQPRVQLEPRRALPAITLVPGGLRISASWHF